MYTDGITEAENHDKALYSADRLMMILQKNILATPKQLIQTVDEDVALHVDKYPQSDDLTMMTIVFYG
jgi:serine phosphatase RsbU (regulator of sigma subunit)